MAITTCPKPPSPSSETRLSCRTVGATRCLRLAAPVGRIHVSNGTQLGCSTNSYPSTDTWRRRYTTLLLDYEPGLNTLIRPGYSRSYLYRRAATTAHDQKVSQLHFAIQYANRPHCGHTRFIHTGCSGIFLAGAGIISAVDEEECDDLWSRSTAGWGIPTGETTTRCVPPHLKYEVTLGVHGSKDNEHETLKSQIEELKTALEHAQMLRRRKIEYDLVAEKVNTLPNREELESWVGTFATLPLC